MHAPLRVGLDRHVEFGRENYLVELPRVFALVRQLADEWQRAGGAEAGEGSCVSKRATLARGGGLGQASRPHRSLPLGPEARRFIPNAKRSDELASQPQSSELWHHQGSTFDRLERAQISVQIAARAAGKGARRLAK